MGDFAIIVTDQGVLLSLALISPQLMKQHRKAAVLSVLEWEAGNKWDVPHRLCFDVLERELRNRRNSPFQKGYIRA
eukprot:7048037-Pyramimonas_sp.AAC.1